jgi:hypothetical protein
MKRGLVISVPHGACEANAPVRMCDTKAFTAAQLFHQKLILKTDPANIHFLPNRDVHREKLDMNRIVSRESDYRNTLRTKMADVTWLFDFHSFPYSAFPLKTPLFILDNIHEEEITDGYYIYNVQTQTDENKLFQPWVEKMQAKFNNTQIKILTGSLVNDIQREARAKGVYALLFEFCEDDAILPPQLLGQILDELVDFYTRSLR